MFSNNLVRIFFFSFNIFGQCVFIFAVFFSSISSNFWQWESTMWRSFLSYTHTVQEFSDYLWCCLHAFYVSIGFQPRKKKTNDSRRRHRGRFFFNSVWLCLLSCIRSKSIISFRSVLFRFVPFLFDSRDLSSKQKENARLFLFFFCCFYFFIKPEKRTNERPTDW